MCKIGDIILITDPKNNGRHIGRHTFVVIKDEGGEIEGIPFDFVGLILSSLKNETDRKRLLKYPTNKEVKSGAMITDPHNGFDACIKADQFYYFSKEKIDYTIIGSLDIEPFNELISFIQELISSGVKIKQVLDNSADIW